MLLFCIISSSKGKDQDWLVPKKRTCPFAVPGLKPFGSVAGSGLIKSAHISPAPTTHLIYKMKQILLSTMEPNYNWQGRFFF